MNGWIKLHRKLIESPVFDNPDMLKVWLWCLLKASHKEHTHLVGLQTVNLQEGQFVFGRKKASVELNLSENKIYRLMKTLETLGNIDMNPNNKFTLVTVGNWRKYQVDQQENEQQIDNKQTTNRQQIDTNKNVKNVKNEKNNKYDDFVSLLLPIYPGKKIRAVRDKKLPEILKGYGEEEILRCVQRYADSVKGTEKQFILNESTFWNGRYMDYLDANYPEGKPVVHQPLKLVIRDSY